MIYTSANRQTHRSQFVFSPSVIDMKKYTIAFCVLCLVSAQALTQEPISDGGSAPKAATHLLADTLDLPDRYKMESQNGMTVTVRDHEKGVDVLLAFGGYRHVSGAVRLTRILFRFPRGTKILCLSDCDAIYYDRADVKLKTVDCLKGYFVIDREQKKIEIDCVVFDNEDWHRFGWNGVWDLKLRPDFDTEDIMKNMGIADFQGTTRENK